MNCAGNKNKQQSKKPVLYVLYSIQQQYTVKKILRLEIAFWEVARGGAGAQHRLGEALIGRFRGFWFASLSFLLLLLLLLLLSLY